MRTLRSASSRNVSNAERQCWSVEARKPSTPCSTISRLEPTGEAMTARAQAIFNHTPTGRFGRAEELVGAAVFLASEKASSFVTGALIRVDGGFGAMTI